MAFWFATGLLSILLILISLLYVHLNDKRLSTIPKEALAFSPERVTPDSARSFAAGLSKSPPISIHSQLPPKTDRRYIVVGGVGGIVIRVPLRRLTSLGRAGF